MANDETVLVAAMATYSENLLRAVVADGCKKPVGGASPDEDNLHRVVVCPCFERLGLVHLFLQVALHVFVILQAYSKPDDFPTELLTPVALLKQETYTRYGYEVSFVVDYHF